MRKIVCACLLGLAIFVMAVPAKADTYVTIVSKDRGRPHHWERPLPRWHHHHRKHWDRVSYAPYYPPAFYAPYARPVVYQSTIIQSAPRVVHDTYLRAEPVSSTYVDARGQACREYTSYATIGGRSQPVYGKACLQPDGVWRVVE